MDHTKTYRFTVRFGEARATDDAEGEVIATSPVRPGEDAIRAALPAFEGVIAQVPPAFSAIKVEGRRAYDLARVAQAPVLAARPVRIEAFRLVRVVDADRAEFEVVCGKGAYMRSLARDLARALGTCGHIAALRRTRVGPFTETTAISLESLADLGHSPRLAAALAPVETVLADIPALALTESEANRLRHGQPVSVLPVATRTPLVGIDQGDVVRAMAQGRLVALAEFKGGEIRPLRVINP